MSDPAICPAQVRGRLIPVPRNDIRLLVVHERLAESLGQPSWATMSFTEAEELVARLADSLAEPQGPPRVLGMKVARPSSSSAEV